MADYYEILGVSRQAATAEIRKAYALLAREKHPDRFSDPTEKARAQEFFKEATAAFNTLSNERTRSEYDAELAKPRATTPEEIARETYAAGAQRYEARQFQEAAELFRAAAHHVPGEPRYQLALGRALARNPQTIREAIEALEAAARLSPGSVAVHLELARLLLGKGLTIRARKVVEVALPLAPEDPELRQLAAEVGLQEGGGGLRGVLRRKP